MAKTLRKQVLFFGLKKGGKKYLIFYKDFFSFFDSIPENFQNRGSRLSYNFFLKTKLREDEKRKKVQNHRILFFYLL
jgi:hypothetical protein